MSIKQQSTVNNRGTWQQQVGPRNCLQWWIHNMKSVNDYNYAAYTRRKQWK